MFKSLTDFYNYKRKKLDRIIEERAGISKQITQLMIMPEIDMRQLEIYNKSLDDLDIIKDALLTELEKINEQIK